MIISRILQRKGFLKWISTYSGKLNLEDGFSEKYNYLQFLKMSSAVIEVAADGPVGMDPRVASILKSDDRVVR